MIPKKVFITYQQYGELLNNMASYLQNRNDLIFDAIVAPPRGALPIAVHLSHYLNIKNILISNHDLTMFLIEHKEPRLLMVDDIVDTGKTMHSYKTRITQCYSCLLFYTASLYYKERSIFEPNYYCMKTDQWIVFPYEHEKEKPNRPGYENL